MIAQGVLFGSVPSDYGAAVCETVSIRTIRGRHRYPSHALIGDSDGGMTVWRCVAADGEAETRQMARQLAFEADEENRSLPDGTYVELVRSLFITLLPASIMSAGLVAAGLLILQETPDPLLALIISLCALAGIARVSLLIACRKRAASADLDPEGARALELRFAGAYFAFAAIFSIFSVRAFFVATPEAHMMIVCLLVGYGAGVAAGVSLRPWISVPSILMAIVPTILVTPFGPGPAYWRTGLLMAMFLTGGIVSMLHRYRTTAAQITMRRLLSTLARHDQLTGLPNRLLLNERFDAMLDAVDDGSSIALHCLDLNRFKPINDRYGHPTGDALLMAATERLNRILRAGDFAVRLGGNEFAIVQMDAANVHEAEMLAHRIASTIAKPYSIEGQTVEVGAKIGYHFGPRHGADLEHFLRCANDALIQAKPDNPEVVRRDG
jgi:diguanylate cyclase (GGDEF)-like protein